MSEDPARRLAEWQAKRLEESETWMAWRRLERERVRDEWRRQAWNVATIVVCGLGSLALLLWLACWLK